VEQGLETAQAFWALLLPAGLQGGALSHIVSKDDDDDDDMGQEEGWKDEYTQWWFDFLNERGGKGVSKDTWIMVRQTSRSFAAVTIRSSVPSSWSLCAPSTQDLQNTTWKVRLPVTMILALDLSICSGLAFNYR
jgi:hypothetical protein